MTVERVDDAGRWVDGVLVEPAPGWLDGIAEAPEQTPAEPSEAPVGYVAVVDLVAAINAAPNTVAGIKAALRSLGGTP